MAEGAQVKIVYKKKKGDHPFHGGSWKVALADFMTALFALFLVMWILAQSQEVRSAVAYYFRHPEDFQGLENVVYEGGLGIDADARGRPEIKAKIHKESSKAIELATQVQRAIGHPELMTFGVQEGNTRPERGESVVKPGPKTAPHDIKTFLELKDELDTLLRKEVKKDNLEEVWEMAVSQKGLVVRLEENRKAPMFVGHSRDFAPAFQKALIILGRELGRLHDRDPDAKVERYNRIEINGHGPGPASREFEKGLKWIGSAETAELARRVMTAAGLKDMQVVRVAGCGDSLPLQTSALKDKTGLGFPRRITILVHPWQWEPESW